MVKAPHSMAVNWGDQQLDFLYFFYLVFLDHISVVGVTTEWALIFLLSFLVDTSMLYGLEHNDLSA